MTRPKREVTGGSAAAGLLGGGSALVVLVVLVIGVLTRLPAHVLVPAVAVSAAAGVVVALLTAAGVRRDRRLCREAAVAVSAWAARNAGQSSTSSAGFAANWTLPASPRFAGAALAVGRTDGFEIGVTCHTHADGEGGPIRHTGVLVLLHRAHPPVCARWRFRGRFTQPVANRLADLPGRVEMVEVEDRELRVSYLGWPAAVDLDACVDGAVEVARALG